jgi:integrase
MTFLELVQMDAKLIWDGEAHRARSITKAERFASFSDYETRGIGDFKPSHIHRFFDRLQEQGLSNNTINHYGAMIVKVFSHAVSEEHISHVPKFKYRKVKGNQRPLYFTKSQIDLMSAYFRNSSEFGGLEHYLTIGIQTGMRIGEIRSINERTLILDETGGYSVYLAETKNGDSRTVPINDQALRAIRKLGTDVSKNWNSKLFYRGWKHMRRAVLNGDTRYTFHTTRHTCATTLANSGAYNTDLIGRFLGHRDLNTTRKYIKTAPETLRSMAELMRGEKSKTITTPPQARQADLFGLEI